MYSYLKSSSTKSLLTTQLPVLVFSLLFANYFYHFHSFLLEAIAFLGTWFVLDGIVKTIKDGLQKE